MIESFKGKIAPQIWNREAPKKFDSRLHRRTYIKLVSIHQARSLQDIALTPGTNLEALKGDRKGQYSIRINSQWRICFTWEDGKAREVEVVDYH
ncbi:hypothetical protein GP475_08840 [Corynebacterium poyangense]|uniref:Plasmid maintenance system killer n=1 Tax=Corynebacterium poyangense TaxID=2684405 RepID=A0A7H0SQA8_9CORY|nr:type II toxin-antitoxin system RelE/ParE family toxin [Corynebacterium poyangense]QNQ90733.1 hypothetical protein GP475_08840 [Corynebacterium poyangense]